jgi:hypothetical protein
MPSNVPSWNNTHHCHPPWLSRGMAAPHFPRCG